MGTEFLSCEMDQLKKNVTSALDGFDAQFDVGCSSDHIRRNIIQTVGLEFYRFKYESRMENQQSALGCAGDKGNVPNEVEAVVDFGKRDKIVTNGRVNEKVKPQPSSSRQLSSVETPTKEQTKRTPSRNQPSRATKCKTASIENKGKSKKRSNDRFEPQPSTYRPCSVENQEQTKEAAVEKQSATGAQSAIQAQVSTSDTALGQVEGSNNVGKRPTRDPDPDSESDISPSKKPKYDGSLGHTFSLEDSVQATQAQAINSETKPDEDSESGHISGHTFDLSERSVARANVSTYGQSTANVIPNQHPETKAEINLMSTRFDGGEIGTEAYSVADLSLIYACHTQDETPYKHECNRNSKIFYCPVCPKTFQYESGFHSHLRSAAHDEVLHPCHHCLLRYETEEEAVNCSETSRCKNFKRFMCPHEGCSFGRSTYKTEGNVRSHVRAVHDGEKPFKCDLCDICFPNKSNLTRHLHSVHNQDWF